MFCLKRAWSSAATPLPIVCPTDYAVPPNRRNIFVDDRAPTIAQHAVHFIQNEPRILGVMKDITKQDGIERLVLNRKMAAVVWKVIDARGSAVANVQTDHGGSKHSLQVMCDEAIAAADVEHGHSGRQHAGNFKRHVISSTNFTAPSHALEATFDRGSQAGH